MNLPKGTQLIRGWNLFDSATQQFVNNNAPLISYRFAFLARSVTLFAVVVVLLLGLLIITERLFQLPPTIEIFSGNLEISLFASYGLICCSLSLWLLSLNQKERSLVLIGKSLALLIVIMGIIIVIGQIIGKTLDFNFADNIWLYQEYLFFNSGANLYQSIILTLIGLALFMIDRGEIAGAEISQWLILIASILLAPSLIGYIYDIRIIEAPINYLPFSLILAYSLISLGIILSRPTQGMMMIISSYGTGGYLARRLLLSAIIIPVVFGWLVLTGNRMGWYNSEVRLILHIAISGIVFAVLIWRSVFALYRIDQDRRRATKSIQFLSDSSKAMSVSMNYHKNFQLITRLASQSVSEWCAIEMFDQKSKLVAFSHSNNKKFNWFRQNIKTKPQFSFDFLNLSKSLQSGHSELWIRQNHIQMSRLLQKPNLYNLLTRLGFDSALIAPIKIKNRVVGMIYLVNSSDQSSYSKSDLALIDELTNRISMAIENVRLYQSVQNAVKTREEFMSIASHELKTPLTTIQVLAGLIKQIAKRDKQKSYFEYTDKMIRQIDRLTDLVNDLLDVSRIQSGKLTFQSEMFDIYELTKEVISAMQNTSQQHKIKLVGTARKKLCGDSERISQVIINLISNAIKYSPQSKDIIVKIESADKYIQIGVQDFGIGISQRDQKRIFDRFYRVKDLGVRSYPGLGIGLYISSEIVRRHKGKIWVESTEGQGSTFYFTIPWDQS